MVRKQGQGLVNWFSKILEDKDFTLCFVLYVPEKLLQPQTGVKEEDERKEKENKFKSNVTYILNIEYALY